MRITHGKDSIGELLNELVYLANCSGDEKVSIVKVGNKVELADYWLTKYIEEDRILGVVDLVECRCYEGAIKCLEVILGGCNYDKRFYLVLERKQEIYWLQRV